MKLPRQSLFRAAVVLLLAFIAQIIPLPAAVDVFRPPFVVLVVIFWSLRAPGVGGGIRTWDATRTPDGVSSGEREVSFDFEVREEIADVELVIELRAKRGSIAFRMDSLRLTRE